MALIRSQPKPVVRATPLPVNYTTETPHASNKASWAVIGTILLVSLALGAWSIWLKGKPSNDISVTVVSNSEISSSFSSKSSSESASFSSVSNSSADSSLSSISSASSYSSVPSYSSAVSASNSSIVVTPEYIPPAPPVVTYSLNITTGQNQKQGYDCPAQIPVIIEITASQNITTSYRIIDQNKQVIATQQITLQANQVYSSTIITNQTTGTQNFTLIISDYDSSVTTSREISCNQPVN